MVRAEGTGQLELVLVLVGDGDRGPGEDLDELEENERECVAAEEHHVRVDGDAAVFEDVIEEPMGSVKMPCSSGMSGQSLWT